MGCVLTLVATPVLNLILGAWLEEFEAFERMKRFSVVIVFDVEKEVIDDGFAFFNLIGYEATGTAFIP